MGIGTGDQVRFIAVVRCGIETLLDRGPFDWVHVDRHYSRQPQAYGIRINSASSHVSALLPTLPKPGSYGPLSSVPYILVAKR